MKDMNDEELQKWLDENRHTVAETARHDEKAYRFLFNLLETEPDNGLPFDFTAKVTRQLQQEKKRNSELLSYIISLAVASLVVAVMVIALYLFEKQLGNGMIITVNKYKWVLILGLFCLLTIQYLDAVFVKSNIFKRR